MLTHTNAHTHTHTWTFDGISNANVMVKSPCYKSVFTVLLKALYTDTMVTRKHHNKFSIATGEKKRKPYITCVYAFTSTHSRLWLETAETVYRHSVSSDHVQRYTFVHFRRCVYRTFEEKLLHSRLWSSYSTWVNALHSWRTYRSSARTAIFTALPLQLSWCQNVFPTFRSLFK